MEAARHSLAAAARRDAATAVRWSESGWPDFALPADLRGRVEAGLVLHVANSVTGARRGDGHRQRSARCSRTRRRSAALGRRGSRQIERGIAVRRRAR